MYHINNEKTLKYFRIFRIFCCDESKSIIYKRNCSCWLTDHSLLLRKNYLFLLLPLKLMSFGHCLIFFFFFYVPNMVWLLDWVVIMEVCFLNCPNRELGDLQVKLYLNWCHNCSIMTSSLWLFFKEWNYVSHSIKQKMHNGTQLFHNWRYFNIHYWKTF